MKSRKLKKQRKERGGKFMRSNVEMVLKTTVSDDSDSYVTLIEADSKNKFNNNIHYHSFYELEFIIDGKGRYEINNSVFEIRRGALFLTPPADYHTYSLSENEKIRYYNVQFFPSLINDDVSSRLYTCSLPIALYFSEEETVEIIRKLEELKRTFDRKSLLYGMEVRNLIENLCIESLRWMEEKKNVNTEAPPTVKAAIIYVKEHYREPITLDTAAEYVGLSSTYFSHRFTEVVGIGFSAYVRDIRLNAAANLIRSTQLTVKEICYKTGFTDPNYFSNAFRAHFGMSPKKYRDMNKH